jgi:hypothetical protein
MSSLSDAGEAMALDHMFTATAVTRPTAWWFALYTAAPSDTGGGTEVTNANAYARTSVVFTRSGTTPTQVANTSQVDFPTATGSWGTITHIGIVTSATHGGGVLLAWAPLDTSRAITTGEIFRVAAGGVVVTLA